MRINRHSVVKTTGRTTLAVALALGLGLPSLTACGGQKAAEQSVTSEAALQKGGGDEVAVSDLDRQGWKTLGDALANITGDLSYSYDDSHFVCVFDAGSSKIRAVAKATPDIADKIVDIDIDDPEYNKKMTVALGDLELLGAEDISDGQLGQEKLDAYVGKTGKDMFDDGFVFSSYFMYGGDQTGATLDFGHYGYEVTFNKSISESQIEDGGEALKDAVVAEVTGNGNLSNMALDPASVK